MTSVRVEILVEPFKDDEPGPHVSATLGALERAGLTVEMGPFSSTVEGDLGVVVGAVAEALTAGFAAGADRISIGVERT